MIHEQAFWLASGRLIQDLSILLHLLPPCFQTSLPCVPKVLLTLRVLRHNTDFYLSFIFLWSPRTSSGLHGSNKDLTFWPISRCVKSCTPLATLGWEISGVLCKSRHLMKTTPLIFFRTYSLHSCNLKLRIAKLMHIFPLHESLLSSQMFPVSHIIESHRLEKTF